VPDIVALRRRAAAIRETELRRFAGRLSDLEPEERAAVEQITHAIVQKLLHPPTVALRRASARGGPKARRTRATILAALQDPLPDDDEAKQAAPAERSGHRGINPPATSTEPAEAGSTRRALQRPSQR
ncbi:MAG: hypothetical protein ACRDJN_03660, partial [Chloroflexota bacterium]